MKAFYNTKRVFNFFNYIPLHIKMYVCFEFLTADLRMLSFAKTDWQLS